MGNLAVARIEKLGLEEGLLVEPSIVEVVHTLPPPPGFKGSPTILVNGIDLEPSARLQRDTGHG